MQPDHRCSAPRSTDPPRPAIHCPHAGSPSTPGRPRARDAATDQPHRLLAQPAQRVAERRRRARIQPLHVVDRHQPHRPRRASARSASARPPTPSADPPDRHRPPGAANATSNAADCGDGQLRPDVVQYPGQEVAQTCERKRRPPPPPVAPPTPAPRPPTLPRPPPATTSSCRSPPPRPAPAPRTPRTPRTPHELELLLAPTPFRAARPPEAPPTAHARPSALRRDATRPGFPSGARPRIGKRDAEPARDRAPSPCQHLDGPASAQIRAPCGQSLRQAFRRMRSHSPVCTPTPAGRTRHHAPLEDRQPAPTRLTGSPRRRRENHDRAV